MNTLEIYQESVPFSNKRLQKPISSNGAFTNPIIMPFAFDFTSNVNSLECVFYVRNKSQEFRYENLVISLMKEDAALKESPVIGNANFVVGDTSSLNVNGYSINAKFAFENSLNNGEEIGILGDENEANGYYNYYVPVDSDDVLTVKFSYGYDEVSPLEWENMGNALIIPYIGTSQMPDTSYHPIRMKIDWKKRSAFVTDRTYFLDISYHEKAIIG